MLTHNWAPVGPVLALASLESIFWFAAAGAKQRKFGAILRHSSSLSRTCAGARTESKRR